MLPYFFIPRNIMTYTTRLDAVNTMLDVIGQAPVNSLDGPIGLDAIKAGAVLTEIDRKVQLMGWDFNDEAEYPLTPSSVSPFHIFIPSNFLSITASDPNRHLVQRGNILYDKDRRSFSFEDGLPVPCNVLLHVPFEELPEAARSYITITAARTFANRTVGDEASNAFTLRDEITSLATLRRNNARTRKKSMKDSWAVMRILAR